MQISVKQLPKALQQKGIEQKISGICRKHNIAFMAIFGSYARQQQTPESDIDIAIEYEPNQKKTLIDLLQTENELSTLFKRKVDLGILSSLSPYIIDDVKKEMHIIYQG